MADGDNLQLGNGNDAQTPTVIEARIRDGVSFFDWGLAIFEAGPSAPPDVPAQQFMGVLGRGADAHPDNLNPGMPGVAGYGGRPSGGASATPDDQQGGCGVMGIGGSTDQGYPRPPASAKWAPGPGIYGIGGVGLLVGPYNRSSANGAGVIGDSGITDLGEVPNVGVGVPTQPSVAETQNIGVYGRSRNGPGVAGYSIGDRGGVFSSSQIGGQSLPQLRLVPQPGTYGVPMAPLPKNGQPGDFFVRLVPILGADDVLPRAELWFCIGPSVPNSSISNWGLVAFSEMQEV